MLIEKLTWIYRAYRYRLKLERQEIQLLLQNLNLGDVGVDIGAHKGAERLLSSCRPCLLFECERRHRGSGRVDDVFIYLESLNYRGFFVDGDGPKDIDRFDPAVHQAESGTPGYVNNFLFLGA
jgi:hypothetical protein